MTHARRRLLALALLAALLLPLGMESAPAEAQDPPPEPQLVIIAEKDG